MALRATWQEQLRKTTATARLEEGRYDLFPLQEVQALTDGWLKTSYRTSLLRRGIEGLSDNDVALAGELNQLKGEVLAQEAGILACLHVISPDLACGLIVDVRQRCEVVDEFFLHRVRPYLQCLIVAFQVRPEIFPTDIINIAKDLLDVVKKHGQHERFPSVIRVLRAVGEERYEEFLPLTLVRSILKHVEYKQNLQKELYELAKSRRWFPAHVLVGGLRDLGRLPEAARLLPDVFPNIPLWAAWVPDRNRILAWEDPILDSCRRHLAPVLDLEGPDSTGNQLRTLRHSSPGIFGPEIHRLPQKNGRNILEHLLCVLDLAAAKGIEAVRLLIAVCVMPKKVSWQTLERVEAALELNSPSHIQRLYDCMRVIEGNDVFERMQAITAALPVIRSTARLQKAFGNAGDLAHRGPHILSAAQIQLCKQLKTGQASERFAIHVGNLGRALLSAQWLHEHWHDDYIKMLRQIPNEIHISATFRLMRAATPELYAAYRDALAASLCASNRKGASPEAVSILQVITPRLVEDTIWSVHLDRDRTNLRNLLLREMMRGFSPSDATACVKQAQSEHDTFIRELRDLVGVDDSDMACVKLAAYLGPRCVPSSRRVKPPAECWRRLLMHLMGRRPAGLLERCAEALSSTTWLDWIRHLQWLYGERHLDPESGLGFTAEKFNAASARKIGVGRTVSQSTNSTTSTGGTMDWS
ncbi:Fc.00g111470.m01.CDS01 [Cosmosporella sp. VM-42]